jgi:hypothetical protein
VKRFKAENARKQPLQTLSLYRSENEVSALTLDKLVPEEVHKKVLRTAQLDLL